MCLGGSTTGGCLSAVVASFTGTIGSGALRFAGVGRMTGTLFGATTVLGWRGVLVGPAMIREKKRTFAGGVSTGFESFTGTTGA